MAKKNLITIQSGMRFGRLLVLCENEKSPKGRRMFLCRCDCGTEKSIVGSDFSSGNTSSCGCLQKDRTRQASTKHGQAANKFRGKVPPEYQAWLSMIARCENPKNKSYKDYGARGITICERWRHSFINFLKDMGTRPNGMSIDRLDNDKGYDKDNCAWRGKLEQAYNRRATLRISFNGETHTLLEWAEKTGMQASMIRQRLRREWPLERVFEPPIRSPHLYRPTIGISVK